MNKSVRLFLLFVLLLVGIWLIWHVGHDLRTYDLVTAVASPAPARSASIPAKESAETAAKTETTKEPAGTSETMPAKPASAKGSLPEIVRTEKGRFVATEPILFNSGASTLREASFPRLNSLADFLKQNGDLEIEIVGHTDTLGPEPVNERVSTERAGLVMSYLVSQGIDPARLSSKGMGSKDPIASNDTQLGRQANRRIEFLVRN